MAILSLLWAAIGFLGTAPRLVAHPGAHRDIADLTELIALAPDRPELLLRRAARFVEHAHWSDAARDLARAGNLAPADPALPHACCGYHLARADVPAAIRALDPLFRGPPGDPAALVLRARAERLVGDTPAALVDFTAALAGPREPKPELLLEAAVLADIELALTRPGPRRPRHRPQVATRATRRRPSPPRSSGRCRRTSGDFSQAPRRSPRKPRKRG